MRIPTITNHAVSRACIPLLLFISLVISPIEGLRAQELPKPTSDVLLTVDGAIDITNGDGVAEFDREMLISLGVKSIKTANPFQTGMHSFDGVLVSDVLMAVGAKGTALNASAVDGYTVQIPIEDVTQYPVMLAMVWNGKVMKVRNRGPLWVIYPLSDFPELVDQKYSARSVWQLKKLTVE